MAQSLKAVKMEGVITVIGFLGGVKGEEQPSLLECLTNICTVRGVFVGSRLQFEQMNAAIDVNGIKPVVDDKVFGFKEVKEAYQYMVCTRKSRFYYFWRMQADSSAFLVGAKTFWETHHSDRLSMISIPAAII